MPSATYRTDFIDAAEHLGVEVMLASDRRQAMASDMGDRAATVDFDRPERAAQTLVALHKRLQFDAVIAADERGVRTAAEVCALPGLVHNPPAAAAATRDKAAMRAKLRAAGVAQPYWAVVSSAGEVADRSFPLVLKPLDRSASQGVIRVDGPHGVGAAIERIRRILCDEDAPVLVEDYVDGVEIAVEGMLCGGVLEILATFDKPDPLIGPYFPETLYVTPSRLKADLLTSAHELVRAASAALGLREGPIHAEVRVDPSATSGPGMWMIEIAGRSIGGLCSRTLRFGLGVTLEELILRRALGLPTPPLRRERTAAGVMMLPIEGGGVLNSVSGVEEAAAVRGISGVEITVAPGTVVEPLPEGDRYLGFIFARGSGPAVVEHALREASAKLRVSYRAQ